MIKPTIAGAARGALVALGLVFLTGCASVNWDALREGVGGLFDEVMDEVAADGGRTSFGDAFNRVSDRRSEEFQAESRRLAEQAESQRLADRAEARASGRSQCRAGTYMDFLLLVSEVYGPLDAVRNSAGSGFVNQVSLDLAQAAEREFADDLRDCPEYTARLIRREMPLLGESNRTARLSGLLLSETQNEDWVRLRDEILPLLASWVRSIY